MREHIDIWLAGFGLNEEIGRHVAEVICQLPDHVRDDLMHDPAFTFYDFEPGPDVVMQVPVGVPTANGHSRCVVLKRTLRHRHPSFTRYVIAHEIAHAHLRNAGRHPHEDPESAADALAAQWGFPRVPWK